jgi:hypothetical protein
VSRELKDGGKERREKIDGKIGEIIWQEKRQEKTNGKNSRNSRVSSTGGIM